MRAWQCDDVRPIPGLFLGEVAMPRPALGRLLIKVHAFGVTPTELSWYPTTHLRSGEDRRHAIPAHEFSGIVSEASPELNIEVGQEVFGMNDWFDNGAAAEFCCASPAAIIAKPTGLTHATAASIPIAGLTAWQGLFDYAGLKTGERVLIHGGSGSVGAFAIQLARRLNAHVFTTASAKNRDQLLRLGAERVIDYHSEQFEEIVGKVDVVFDAVGGPTLQRSWGVLGPNGRLVTVAASSEAMTDDRVKRCFFIVEPNMKQLRDIAGLVDSGDLESVIDTIVPFVQTADAYQRRLASARGFGKAVVEVNSAD
jgi:NADPH:quinone reductase-like Zn-dependent oxidoreductase